MKKERIMVNGIKYRYIINDSNQIELNKEVSSLVFDRIKNILIRKGKYKEIRSEEIEEKSLDESDLKIRFKKWAKAELKMYRDELERKKDLSELEKLILKVIKEEIERRD